MLHNRRWRYGVLLSMLIESGEGLVVPRTERHSAAHITFDGWGPRPHEIILRITDIRSNERQTETVTLIPRR